MSEVYKKDHAFVKRYIKTQTESGLIIGGMELELPCNDTHIDTVRKETIVSAESSSKFGKMMDNFNEAKPISFLEKNVKLKVATVSKNIQKMDRLNPTDSNIYCMSSLEMQKYSVFNMTSISHIHGYNTFGLFDKRLGCLEPRKTCVTCFRKTGKCEGHSAFISFEHKHVNPLFQRDVIYDLRCTCSCGHVYATMPLIRALKLHKLSGLNYKKALAELSDSLHALHKHESYEKIIYENAMSDHKIVYRKASKPNELWAKNLNNVKTIFDNYSEEDLKVLGYTGKTHPSSFIMCGMLTVSPSLRLPGYINDTLQHHYLTSHYIEIIKYNNQLRNNKDAEEKTTEQILASQYAKIKEIFNGPDNKSKSRVVEQDGGLMSNLTGKNGLLRKHGMGKRVDFSARSVASSFVDGSRGDIGIPRSFCKTIEIKEKITIYNIEKYQQMVKTGKVKNIVGYKNGEEISCTILEYGRNSKRLHIGDTIFRPLKDGDTVLFGRQPSLHAFSLPGGKIILHDDEVIKIPTDVLKGLNLDFDGDEVTLHFIQTIEGRTESLTTTSTLYHIMNEQSNSSAVGIAFHGLLGSYLATETWKYVTHEDFDEDEYENNIENAGSDAERDALVKQREDIYTDRLSIDRSVMIPEERWEEAISLINNSHRKRSLKKRCKLHGVTYKSGRALMSLPFPENLTYNAHGLDIRDGILVKGVLNKGNVGTGSKSLVQVIYKLFSLKEANRFINEVTKLADWFIMWHGFSIGQHTFVTNRKEIRNKIQSDINSIQMRVYMLDEFPANEMDQFLWKKRLHGMIDEIQQLGKNIGNSYLKKNNELNILGSDGAAAKGSYMNTSQITSLLGTQKIKGDIQIMELNNGTRHLVSFLPGDCAIESFGYILQSFYDGLTPSGMMFHMSASREGLINTANDTSDIGYTHRRLVKALEDTILDSRGMISTTSGRIIQFTYCGISIQNQVYVKTKELGEKLSFCNFQQLADNINGMHEYIKNKRAGIL